MPMYGERLAAAMSCAVPVSIVDAMLAAITVAVIIVIRWRAALPWQRALRRLPQPDGAATPAATALMIITARTPLTLLLKPLSITALMLLPLLWLLPLITALMLLLLLLPPLITALMLLPLLLLPLSTTAPMLQALSITAATPTAATSRDGQRCFRATMPSPSAVSMTLRLERRPTGPRAVTSTC